MSSTRLPWDIQEFKRSDLVFVAVAAVLCIAIPFVSVPPPAPQPLPERVVILPPVVELPPPPVIEPEPVVEPEPIPEPKPEPKPEPVKPVVVPKPVVLPKPVVVPKPVVTPKPEPVRTPTPPAAKPQPLPRPATPTAVQPKPAPVAPPQPSPAELRAAAQQRARDAVKDTGLTSAIGNLSNTPSSPSNRPVTSNAAQTSSSNTTGLKTAASQATQSNLQVARASTTDKPAVGGNLSDRQSRDVSQGQIKDQARSTPATAASTSSGKSGRGDSEVERVINQAKGRMQNAYQRALDDDPTMEGSVVVRLKIKADGSVTSVSIVSSALNNKALEDRFLTILRGLKFSDGEFEEYNKTYTLNFLPL